MTVTRFGLLALAALTACASAGTEFDPKVVDSLAPGMTVAQVDAKLGKPNGEVFAADGRRVQTWMYSHSNMLSGGSSARTLAILFDADGKMVRVASKGQTDMHVNGTP